MKFFAPAFAFLATVSAENVLSNGKKSTVRLNNGVDMPVLGLGTWQSSTGEVKAAVRYAIEEAGYVHIDTAWVYGNQNEIGEAIRELIDEKVITRDQIFLTTKVWLVFFGEGDVLKSVYDILDQLGLVYVDQMLLHFPAAIVKEYDENGQVNPWPRQEDGHTKLSELNLRRAWLELEAAYKEGLARSIGVSNFEPEHIEQVTNPAHPNMAGGLCEDCEVPPAVNQVELHPSLPQRGLSRYCRERGIEMVAYSPLANPGLIENNPDNTPDFKHPNPLQNTDILEIANAHGKSAAQVLLRWSLQNGNIVIPKSVKTHRILENSEIFDFHLSKREMRIIDYLSADASRRARVINPDFGANNGYLFPSDTDIDLDPHSEEL